MVTDGNCSYCILSHYIVYLKPIQYCMLIATKKKTVTYDAIEILAIIVNQDAINNKNIIKTLNR